jgi:carbon-monoxide dehydrogenase medium subunit
MRPSKFDYMRPSSVEEAVSMLAQNGGAKALAGGHSLIPAMNLRLSQPEGLVDIGRLDSLRGISVKGSTLSIGALTTHAQIAASADVQKHAPALASACGHVGDPAVRNWGTLGGNIAHADPASDPPTVLLASGVTIHTHGEGGKRAIPAAEFFLDTFTVNLEPGELITRVDIPSVGSSKSAYIKFAHPASRYAVVGVCVVLSMKGDTCSNAIIAVGGAVPKATLAPGAAGVLRGKQITDANVEAAANALIDEVSADVTGDIFAPAHYRRAMVGVYLKKAIHAALSA